MNDHKSDYSKGSVIALILFMGPAHAQDSVLCNCPDGSVGSASNATGGLSRSGSVTDNATPLFSSPATSESNQRAGIAVPSASSPEGCACSPSSGASVSDALGINRSSTSISGFNSNSSSGLGSDTTGTGARGTGNNLSTGEANGFNSTPSGSAAGGGLSGPSASGAGGGGATTGSR